MSEPTTPTFRDEITAALITAMGADQTAMITAGLDTIAKDGSLNELALAAISVPELRAINPEVITGGLARSIVGYMIKRAQQAQQLNIQGGVEVVEETTKSYAGAGVPSDPYMDLVMRRIDLKEARARGIEFIADDRTMNALASIVEWYVLMAANFDQQLATASEEAHNRMTLIGVPGEFQDDFYQWMVDATMDPITHSNKWLREAALKTMFAKMDGLFGDAWSQFMALMSQFADTVDTHGMLNGIGQVDLKSFQGLGRLKNDMPLMAEALFQGAGRGTLISSARPVITMRDAFFNLFDSLDVAQFAGNKKGRIEQQLEFLRKLTDISPNPFRLSRISGGMVYLLGATPQEIGSEIPPALKNAFGQAALLHQSLYLQVSREAGLQTQSGGFQAQRTMDQGRPAEREERVTTVKKFRFWINIGMGREEITVR